MPVLPQIQCSALLPRENRLRPSRLPSLGRFALACALLLASSVAQAVLIDSGDGTGNTLPPSADPGFANVGKTTTNLTAVYVRNGWVLTANHVGDQPVIFGGVIHQPIPGSKVRFSNPDGTFADLIAYKLQTEPTLPDLALASQSPSSNAVVTLIGNGWGRGASTSWSGNDGYYWLGVREIRWGTNRISNASLTVLDTRAFSTTFDDFPTPGSDHEADVVNGDSGGAAFVGSGASAELIGILFARSGFENQPAGTSLYGNQGYMADLFAYRGDILAIIDAPDCDNGLDDDGDGTVDLGDAGCADALDDDERGAPFECDNGVDDDLDGFVDYPDDPGCLHPTNLYELPAPEPGFGIGLALSALGLGEASRRRNAKRDRALIERGHTSFE